MFRVVNKELMFDFCLFLEIASKEMTLDNKKKKHERTLSVELTFLWADQTVSAKCASSRILILNFTNHEIGLMIIMKQKV